MQTYRVTFTHQSTGGLVGSPVDFKKAADATDYALQMVRRHPKAQAHIETRKA